MQAFNLINDIFCFQIQLLHTSILDDLGGQKRNFSFITDVEVYCYVILSLISTT